MTHKIFSEDGNLLSMLIGYDMPQNSSNNSE